MSGDPSSLSTNEPCGAEERAASEATRQFEFIRRRKAELEAEGKTPIQARIVAALEEGVSRWPTEWGNELQIFVYGNFQPPEEELRLPDLGIVVEAEEVKNFFVTTAGCVVKARVRVSDRSVEGLLKAGARIDTFWMSGQPSKREMLAAVGGARYSPVARWVE